MGETLRVAIEVGPKGKRTVAVAPDWPGLERGAKTEQLAIDRLLDCVPRYAVVAGHAGLSGSLPGSDAADVVERYPGTGSTDFWGISFAFSQHDHAPMTRDDLDRELALMRGAWQVFDDTRARVSPALRKGPRGGGRDRDQIVNHTFGTERDWAGGLGVRTEPGVMLTDDGLATHRAAYVDAIRAFHADGRMAKKWPLRYLIRHTAYHTLDHAWEMEDKDLTGEPTA